MNMYKLKKNATLIILLLLSHIAFAQNLKQSIPYLQNDRWGFANADGTVLIKAKYDSVTFFNGNGLSKIKINSLYGYLNDRGTEIIVPKFHSCEHVKYDLFKIQDSLKYKLINSKEELVIPYKFDSLRAINSVLYFIGNNNKYGIIKIEETGVKTIVSLNFELIKLNNYNLLECTTPDKKTIYYNVEGDLIDDTTRDKIKTQQDNSSIYLIEEPWSESREYERERVYKSNGKYGLIVHKNSRLQSNNKVNDSIPALYDSIYITDKTNFILVKKNKKWGAINDAGETILEIKYDSIDHEKSSMVSFLPYTQRFYVFNKGKCGIIGNKNGFNEFGAKNEILIPIIYESIYYYGRGDYLFLRIKGKYGIMNQDGFAFITEIKYLSIHKEWIYSSQPILFKVLDSKNRMYYVDINGKEFINLEK